MGASGFFLGIPVFFDTVFYLLVPLAKGLAASTKKITACMYWRLSLVDPLPTQIPPTPGPLFVAEELGIDIGAMMLAGIAVGSVAALSGMATLNGSINGIPYPFVT